jgi:hypothetical protein
MGAAPLASSALSEWRGNWPMKKADFVQGYADAIDRMHATKRVNLALPSLFMDAWTKLEQSGAESIDVQVGKMNPGGVSATASVAQKISQDKASHPLYTVTVDHAVAAIDKDSLDFLLAHGATAKDLSGIGDCVFRAIVNAKIGAS